MATEKRKRDSRTQPSRSTLRAASVGLVVFVIVLNSEVSSQPLECPHFFNAPCVNETRTNQSVACLPDLSNISIGTCADENACVVSIVISDFTPSVVSAHCTSIGTEMGMIPTVCREVSSECVFSRSSEAPLGISYTCCCSTTTCANSELMVVLEADVGSSENSPTTPSDNINCTTTTSVTCNDGSHQSVVVAVATTIIVVVIVATAVIIGAFLCVCWRNKLFPIRQESGRGREEFAMISRGAPLPWTLHQLVGQGRFGRVYSATCGDQLVAVKIYSQPSRSWYENERDISSLDSTPHHHIVEYLTDVAREVMDTAGPSPLEFYLVTKFYPLGSLLEYLQTQVVTWDQACRMVVGVASGLRHLHGNHYDRDGVRNDKYPVAHRDLKTSNILLRSEDGDCVVADLGLALVLKPIDDPREIANCGQVGTPRYMSPEALEARINLFDIQSFKQIDIYALGLVMWEVMNRCCVLTEDEVEPYQPPYWDLVPQATIENMKEVVCVQECRPSISAIWNDYAPLSHYAEMVKECFDRDPEARPSAGNIAHRITTLMETSSLNELSRERSTISLPDNQQSSLVGAANSLGRSRSYVFASMVIPENSQSSPPPCYSPTNPNSIPFLGRMRPGLNRNSMPHIIQTDIGNDASLYRPCRSLRSSVTTPPAPAQLEENGNFNQHVPSTSTVQARNSLFRLPGHPLPDNVSVDSGSTSMVCDSQASEECSASNMELGRHIPSIDSGIPVHSQSNVQPFEDSCEPSQC